jgi:Helix-turn-helix.
MAKNRIKELRNSANPKITLKELSDKLKEKGLSFTDSQLSYYENGIRSPRSKVSDEFWQALSEIFNVDVSYLLGYSNDNLMANISKIEDRLDDSELAQIYFKETGEVFDDEAKKKFLHQALESGRITKEFNRQFLTELPKIENTNFDLRLLNFQDRKESKLKYDLAKLFTNAGCFLSDTDINLIFQTACNLSEKNVGKDLQAFFDNLNEEDYSMMDLAMKEMEDEENAD